jgi:hypothetical protein
LRNKCLERAKQREEARQREIKYLKMTSQRQKKCIVFRTEGLFLAPDVNFYCEIQPQTSRATRTTVMLLLKTVLEKRIGAPVRGLSRGQTATA